MQRLVFEASQLLIATDPPMIAQHARATQNELDLLIGLDDGQVSPIARRLRSELPAAGLPGADGATTAEQRNAQSKAWVAEHHEIVDGLLQTTFAVCKWPTRELRGSAPATDAITS